VRFSIRSIMVWLVGQQDQKKEKPGRPFGLPGFQTII
jgi:hypothetical protein